MYNEKIKIEYLKLQKSDYDNFKALFKEVESFEKSNEEDIFNIPTELSLQYILQQGKITTLQSLKKKASLIRKYKTWALVENLVNDEARYIEPRLKIQKLFNEYNKALIFKTPQELKDLTDKYFLNRSEIGVTTDELLTAYLMLIYQGFRKDEVLLLKLDNIHIAKNYMIIKNDRVAAIVYKEFYNALYKIYTNRKYAKLSLADREVVDMDDYFITIGDPYDTDRKSLKGKLSKARSRKLPADIRFDVDSLYMMGRVYEGKLFNRTINEIIEIASEGLPQNKAAFKENLRVMYKNW